MFKNVSTEKVQTCILALCTLCTKTGKLHKLQVVLFLPETRVNTLQIPVQMTCGLLHLKMSNPNKQNYISTILSMASFYAHLLQKLKKIFFRRDFIICFSLESTLKLWVFGLFVDDKQQFQPAVQRVFLPFKQTESLHLNR